MHICYLKGYVSYFGLMVRFVAYLMLDQPLVEGGSQGSRILEAVRARTMYFRTLHLYLLFSDTRL
jgi:hypothetical protein